MAKYSPIVLDDGYKSIKCIATFIDDHANHLWRNTIGLAGLIINMNSKQSIIDPESSEYDPETAPFWRDMRDAFFSKNQIAFGDSVANIYRKTLESYPVISYKEHTHMYTFQTNVFNMYCCFKYIISSSNPTLFSEHLSSIRNLPFLEKICAPHPMIKFNFNYEFVEKMIHAIYLRCK